jgi:hypothetical protein
MLRVGFVAVTVTPETPKPNDKLHSFITGWYFHVLLLAFTSHYRQCETVYFGKEIYMG